MASDSATGVIDGCEPSCGYWELNPGTLQGQQVLLTAETALQSQKKRTFLVGYTGRHYGSGSLELSFENGKENGNCKTF